MYWYGCGKPETAKVLLATLFFMSQITTQMKKIIALCACLLFLSYLKGSSQNYTQEKVLRHCGNILPDTLVKLSQKPSVDVREWLTINGWIPFVSSLNKNPKYKWAYDFKPNDAENDALNYVRLYIYPTSEESKIFMIILETTMPESASVFTKRILEAGYKRANTSSDDSDNIFRYSKTNSTGESQLVFQSRVPASDNYLAVPLHNLAIVQY